MIYQAIHGLNNPQFLRTTLGIKVARLVRFGAHSFRCFASMPFFINFLSWGHREQDAPDKNKKRQQRRMQVRQELYLTHQIRKSPTGCRAFLLPKELHITCIMLILENLQSIFVIFSTKNRINIKL